MSDLAQLEQELAEAEDGLNTCTMALEMDPRDNDARDLIPTFKSQIADLKAQISVAKTSQTAAPPPPPNYLPPKYDMSKHPKFQTSAADVPPPPPEETRVTFNVGDSVQAKYSADRQWYPATIVAKTGSSSDPVYTVKFTGYNEKEQKRKHEVRPVENNKKRKADSTPAPTNAIPPPPPPVSPKATSHATVISAAPLIDTTALQKKEPSKVSDGPTRMAPAPKKLKGQKALEKGKSSWNDWQKSGPKKPAIGGSTKLKKDSQFRTPDLPGAKVGFTGSGKPMTKDQVRTKWNFGKTDDPED
ncbi:hypothetical protein AC578_9903 [Pseudocercospora eumusae]|uniref:Tudor domain-containing protein n=1 Tax=Pseudocercospora eumusae TaxID=321146 RepID=A0A139HB87_9PEZI|nr:hypothetical protein AC578_9903 [Pseudocercospora eumusae]